MLINKIRKFLFGKLVHFYPWYLRNIYKMDIGHNVRISGELIWILR